MAMVLIDKVKRCPKRVLDKTIQLSSAVCFEQATVIVLKYNLKVFKLFGNLFLYMYVKRFRLYKRVVIKFLFWFFLNN